jgi:hypothetical protein
MKYLLNYKTHSLLEAFNLNKMYQKQNIIPEIQVEAKRIVDQYFDAATEIPADMKRNRDKVVLWIAKQIKAKQIESSLVVIDALSSNEVDSGDNIYLSDLKKYYDYLRCKGTMDNFQDEELKDVFLKGITNFTEYHTLAGIFDYFLSPARNQHEAINLVSSTLEEMENIQVQWHNELKASGKIVKEKGRIIKTFPDGYYWIDLLTNNNKEEADAMGHCGRTTAHTILSLRKKSDAGHIMPYVTVAIDYDSESLNKHTSTNTNMKFSIIHQIKGKGNTKPVAKYHPYIVEFLKDKNLGNFVLLLDEYSSNNDFNISDLTDDSQIEELFNSNPKLFNSIHDIIFLYNKGIMDKKTTLDYAERPSIHKTAKNFAILYSKGIADEVDVIDKIKVANDAVSLKGGKIYIETELNDFSQLFYNRDEYRECIKKINRSDSQMVRYAVEFLVNKINEYIIPKTKWTIDGDNRFSEFELQYNNGKLKLRVPNRSITLDISEIIYMIKPVSRTPTGFDDGSMRYSFENSSDDYIVFSEYELMNYIHRQPG